MARHRAESDRPSWPWSSAPAVVPVPRRAGIEIVDAETGMAHRVSAEELMAGRARGNDALGRAVHLLPAGEHFQQGYGSTPVAVCGELVTSHPDYDDDPHYCPDCVSEALLRCARS